MWPFKKKPKPIRESELERANSDLSADLQSTLQENTALEEENIELKKALEQANKDIADGIENSRKLQAELDKAQSDFVRIRELTKNAVEDASAQAVQKIDELFQARTTKEQPSSTPPKS